MVSVCPSSHESTWELARHSGSSSSTLLSSLATLTLLSGSANSCARGLRIMNKMAITVLASTYPLLKDY